MEYNYASNPVIKSDFPDPDVIRAGDTYYMVCTSMYLMPSGDLLRSYDLLHWEFVCHIFERLEDNPAHRLENGKNIFGEGMWAPSMRWHNGKFYVTFSCNDTHLSHLFTAEAPEGPWTHSIMGDFFTIPRCFSMMTAGFISFTATAGSDLQSLIPKHGSLRKEDLTVLLLRTNLISLWDMREVIYINLTANIICLPVICPPAIRLLKPRTVLFPTT